MKKLVRLEMCTQIVSLTIFSAILMCLSNRFLIGCKILNQDPLPQKRPRQKGFGVYRYLFSPFLHGEIKSRRNADTAAT
jgi:hypothetical protein